MSQAGKTNGLAVASIVCGCLAIIPALGLLLAVLAIIFGAVARKKIRTTDGAQKGARLALTGMTLGIPLSIAGVLLVAGTSPPTTAALAVSPTTTARARQTTPRSTSTRPRAIPASTSTRPRSTPTTDSPAPATTQVTTPPPPATQIGQTVKDGDFAFVVHGISCGASAAAAVNDGGFGETVPAGAQECLVAMSVTDDKGTAQTFFDSNQYGYDAAGHQYSADSSGSLYLSNSNDGTQVNPGITISAIVPFQIPSSVHLVKLDLHDSMFSGGVSVRL